MKSWPGPSLPRLPGTGPRLRLFDSASGSLQEAGNGEIVRMYVCGITPYASTHLGHAATYVAFDLVDRVWRDAGKIVSYVQNVTDVDDPLLENAAMTSQSWRELASEGVDVFRADMTALRVLPPDSYVSAVEAMPEIISLIEMLRAKGAVYDVDGDLYFPASADPRFGAIGRLPVNEMIKLSRERGGDPDRPGKKDPIDCLLWKAERPGEPAWDSPFGRGRPGWHIECAAIALEQLGMTIDIQGGGSDLIFPHHEFSAAEAQVATARAPYAKAYVHAGMVGLGGEKMSKSKGNLIFVSALRRSGVDPMAIRLAILGHHYCDDWEWTDGDLAVATERLGRWRAAVSRPDGHSGEPLLAQIRAHLGNDLDAPSALTAIDRWVAGQLAAGGDDPNGPGVVSRAADALLGIAL